MPRRKRAAFGDEASWSPATFIEVERHIRSFQAVCGREGRNDVAPDERWLAEHLQDVRETKGRSFARRYARSVGHHLRRCKAAPLIDGKLVRAVLRAPDDVDPLAIDLDADDLGFSLGRAQVFVDDAFRSTTYENYTNVAKKWVKRCKELGIDPARPPIKELEQFFEDLAQVRAASTVSNHRSAIKYFFRKHDTPDLTESDEIKRIIDGVKRAKPPKRVRAVSADVRYRMLSSFEDVGAGVRDRVIVLLTAFTRLGCERIALLQAEQCQLSDDCVEILPIGSEGSIYVGAHPDRDLNIVYWLERLLELVPSGPLFRSVVPREMRFGDVGLTPITVNKIVAQAAKRAGEPPDDMAARLRLLFDAETHLRESSVILAFQNDRKRLPNDGSESARRRKIKARSVGKSVSAQALA